MWRQDRADASDAAAARRLPSPSDRNRPVPRDRSPAIDWEYLLRYKIADLSKLVINRSHRVPHQSQVFERPPLVGVLNQFQPPCPVVVSASINGFNTRALVLAVGSPRLTVWMGVIVPVAAVSPWV